MIVDQLVILTLLGIVIIACLAQKGKEDEILRNKHNNYYDRYADYR